MQVEVSGVQKKMEKDTLRSNNNINTTNSIHKSGGGGDGLLRTISEATITTTRQTTSDFVLQWGNRKRLRCMKIQVKDKDKDDSNAPVHRTTVRVDRRVVRADKDFSTPPSTTATANTHNTNRYLNLRQRPSSPPQRILRNSENSIAMRGGHGQSNGGGVRGITSPDRGAHDKKGTTNHHHHNSNNHENSNYNNNNKSGASSETAHDSKRGGGGGSSSGGSGEAVAAQLPQPPIVWPPKFVIALTNKEKEEDFIAFKGSKLPQRPKKRAKFIQRTLNLVSPGAWLCDLTLERYEVREKKITKKRPRGLKAMGNMESDSE